MTIQMLYQKISRCVDLLAQGAGLDAAVFDLEILVTQLRIRLHAGIYDSTKQFEQGQLPDVTRLVALADQLAEAPVLEERTWMVTELAALVKAVLRNEGISFYS